jgi:hypothetical protein
MRASQWILGLATTAATVACVAAGCGGSTSGGSSNDSGAPDVTADHVEAAVEAAAETGPEAASDSPPPCTSDAQITSIPIPDGSVPGSDASAAVCLGCVETACPNLVMECNAFCGCPAAFDMFEQCIQAGGNVMTCGETDLLGAGLPIQDLTCALGCANACGITLEGGLEGGGKEGGGGDGSSDANGQ